MDTSRNLHSQLMCLRSGVGRISHFSGVRSSRITRAPGITPGNRMSCVLFPCLPPFGDVTAMDVAPGDAVAVTVVTPLVYPVMIAVAVDCTRSTCIHADGGITINAGYATSCCRSRQRNGGSVYDQTGRLIFNRKVHRGRCPGNDTGRAGAYDQDR